MAPKAQTAAKRPTAGKAPAAASTATPDASTSTAAAPATKKATKAPKAAASGDKTGKGKRRATRVETYSTYIYRVLKQGQRHPTLPHSLIISITVTRCVPVPHLLPFLSLSLPSAVSQCTPTPASASGPCRS